MREIAGARNLRGALSTVFATSLLCSPLVTFAPVLVSKTFHGDAQDFSLAIGAFGLGGLLGAAGLLGIPAQLDRRRWSSRLAALYGVMVVVAALVPWFWVLPPLMVIAGAAMTMSNTSANSILQSGASPRLLGQTVSLSMLATRGGIPLGSLLTGLAIEIVGVQPALLINGALAVIVHLIIGRAWIARRQRPPTPSRSP